MTGVRCCCRFRWQKNPLLLKFTFQRGKRAIHNVMLFIWYKYMYISVCGVEWSGVEAGAKRKQKWGIMDYTLAREDFTGKDLSPKIWRRKGGTEAYQKEGWARTKNKCGLFRCTVSGIGMDTVERKRISYCCCNEHMPRRNGGRQSWPQLTVWGFILAWWEKAALSLRGRT